MHTHVAYFARRITKAQNWVNAKNANKSQEYITILTAGKYKLRTNSRYAANYILLQPKKKQQIFLNTRPYRWKIKPIEINYEISSLHQKLQSNNQMIVYTYYLQKTKTLQMLTVSKIICDNL